MALRRPMACVAAASLGAAAMLTASPAGAAGESTPPPVQDIATFCAAAGDSGFTDTDGGTFEAAIDCIAATDPAITQGGPGALPPSAYGPSLSVTRAQMASFIARMIDAADALDTGDNIRALPEYDGTPAFTDIGTAQSADNPHFTNINRLEQAGIVEGGPGSLPASQYGPNEAVTRAQMASFINRAIAYMTGAPLESADDYFADDEDATPHEPNINAIASVGIVQGVDQAGDTYAPGRSVSRAQMAGFIARTLGELEERGDITPLPEGGGDTGGGGTGGGGGGTPPPPPLTGVFVDDDASFVGVEDGTSERPFDTIQEGVDAAEAGDNVIVRDGTYTETVLVNVDDDLTIIAVDAGADNGIRPHLTGTFAIEGVTGTTISGFEVDPESYQNEISAFSLNDVSGIVIEDNVVSNSGEVLQGTGVINAFSGATEEVTIRDNEFTNLVRGTFANPTAAFLITGNTFSDSTVGAANDATSEIRDNVFTRLDEAIGLATVADAGITGNDFADNVVHVRDYTGDLGNDLDMIEAANAFDFADVQPEAIYGVPPV